MPTSVEPDRVPGAPLSRYPAPQESRPGDDSARSPWRRKGAVILATTGLAVVLLAVVGAVVIVSSHSVPSAPTGHTIAPFAPPTASKTAAPTTATAAPTSTPAAVSPTPTPPPAPTATAETIAPPITADAPREPDNRPTWRHRLFPNLFP